MSKILSTREVKTVIPKYYLHGSRKANILHTRLRTNCSALNLCLFQKNIVQSPLCNCGEIESNDHFLLRCYLHQNIRTEMLLAVNRICTVTTEILLYGNPDLSDEDNVIIFDSVQKFILKSKRFDWGSQTAQNLVSLHQALILPDENQNDQPNCFHHSPYSITHVYICLIMHV